jgi:hypothetical protein
VGQRRYEQLADQVWLWHRYIEQQIPVSGIANELGCTEATARHALVPPVSLADPEVPDTCTRS